MLTRRVSLGFYLQSMCISHHPPPPAGDFNAENALQLAQSQNCNTVGAGILRNDVVALLSCRARHVSYRIGTAQANFKYLSALHAVKAQSGAYICHWTGVGGNVETFVRRAIVSP